MDELIKLVRTYRVTTGLAERLRLAEEVFRLIGPDLRFFVFSAIPHDAAKDVSQEVLKAVFTSLGGFQGGSAPEFWAWCYRIARNKINDHLRRVMTERLQPMPPEELRRLVEASAPGGTLTPTDRHDLDYAMKLLTATKPECY